MAPTPNPPQKAAKPTGAAGELICEVRASSGVYRDWTAVVVQFNVQTNAMRTFRLTVAEPSDAKGKTLADLRLKPGDRVDVALAGKLVIKEGYVKCRQVAFDANRHGVQIDGYSKAAPFMDVSVEPREQKNVTFDAVARKTLGQYGLQFKMGKAPEGSKEPFRRAMPQYGETVWDYLTRLAKRRGLWLTCEADGTVVAGKPERSESKFLIEEGVNIVAGSCLIDDPAVDGIIGRSQQPGSDSLFGKQAAEVSSKAEVSSEIKGGKRIVLAEGAADQKETQARVNMEAAALAASSLRVQIVLAGWLKPDGSGLWDFGEQVTVKSPTLFPTQDGEMDLYVWGVTFAQDARSGTTTTLELVNRAAMELVNPSYTGQADPYNPGSQPAKPEADA